LRDATEVTGLAGPGYRMDRFELEKPKLLGPLVQMQDRAVRVQRHVKFLVILGVAPEGRLRGT